MPYFRPVDVFDTNLRFFSVSMCLTVCNNSWY